MAPQWDLELEPEGFGERRVEELMKHRTAFLAKRLPFSPPSSPFRKSPSSKSPKSKRAAGVFAGLSEEERKIKEEEMDTWRREQFQRRDEERRLRALAETEKKAAALKEKADKQKEREAKKREAELKAAASGKVKKVTPYLCFAKEKREELKSQNPNLDSAAVTAMVGVMWKTVNPQLKKTYEQKSKAENKKRREELSKIKKAQKAKDKAEEEKTRQDALAAAEAEGSEEWIQCDACKKWRVIPAQIATLLDATSQSVGWQCSMNTWDDPPPAGTRACDVPEEKFELDEEDEADVAYGASMVWPPEAWVAGLKCDAKDEYGTWYKAKVVKVKADQSQALIHYLGWSSKHDEWASIQPLDEDKLARFCTHTAPKMKGPPVPTATDAAADASAASAADASDADTAQPAAAAAAAAAAPAPASAAGMEVEQTPAAADAAGAARGSIDHSPSIEKRLFQESPVAAGTAAEAVAPESQELAAAEAQGGQGPAKRPKPSP